MDRGNLRSSSSREGLTEGFRFPAASRMRLRDDIRSTLRRGKHRRTSHLDVFHVVSPAARPRIGIVVPKHGHTIVERNLLRRRLREIGRTGVLPTLWERGCLKDILFRARPGAYEAGFTELSSEMKGAVEAVCSKDPS